MAYEKNTWVTGDIVTSAKLNHMEDGIEGAYEVMVIDDTDGTLDKTWQEIYDAMSQGKLCVVRTDKGDLEGGITANMVTSIYFTSEEGAVYAGQATYITSSTTGYPASDGDGGGLS